MAFIHNGSSLLGSTHTVSSQVNSMAFSREELIRWCSSPLQNLEQEYIEVSGQCILATVKSKLHVNAENLLDGLNLRTLA